MQKNLRNHSLKNYDNVEKISFLVKKLMAPNPSPFTLFGTGTFIIGRKQVCIIDPGPLIESHINKLLSSIDRKRISHILVTHTHADHSPAANILKKETGAKTYAYDSYPKGIIGNRFEEAHDKNFVPDIRLKDNDIIQGEDWTIKAIHTPGHTSNHLCYSLEQEKILFTGDHVMGWATTVVVPPDGDMDDYIESLKKLLLYDYSIYYPTHGNPIKEPKKYVRGLITHRKMREVQILEELKKNSLCIDEMVPKFYSTTDKRLWPAASMSLLATLISLEKKKKIFCKKNDLEDNKKVWLYNKL
mgnify:CR=1 FL=1